MLYHFITTVLLFLFPVLLAWPLGRYMSKVYQGEKNILDFFDAAERKVFSICNINPDREMNWKQYIIAMLVINGVWLLWGLLILLIQGSLFLNPAGNPSMEWGLAFNSAVSFITSTNLQHYSGESGATYLSQVTVFMFLQFVSAATGLSAGVAVVRGLSKTSSKSLGNFYSDFVKSCTRILFPLSVITAIIFLLNGMPMTFQGPQKIRGLQGDSITVAMGPVAAFISIKELGSNGGGFFAANDAHPFENPNFTTFIVHVVIVFILPMAFIFMIGYMLNERAFGRMLFGVMSAGFILVTVPIIQQETAGNPAIHAMGINTASGNMEGKEVRFGSFYSAFYAGENVAVPAGTVVSSHDSFMPLSAITLLLAMNIDAFFGGAGTGWINMFIFLIIAVFIGTLMIGRTPEIMGLKIGVPEMRVAAGISVLAILVPLALAAVAAYVYTIYPGGNERLGWLSNHGAHGFTTMLYEYISSFAGNGSEFSGLGGNTMFWNLTTAVAMLSGRFIPIIGALIIAGMLREKKYVPPARGTLKTSGLTFGVFLLGVILIINCLSLFVSLILGPIAEHMR